VCSERPPAKLDDAKLPFVRTVDRVSNVSHDFGPSIANGGLDCCHDPPGLQSHRKSVVEDFESVSNHAGGIRLAGFHEPGMPSVRILARER
jgi:hypothetical protein